MSFSTIINLRASARVDVKEETNFQIKSGGLFEGLFLEDL
jgi:hypothetical protein